MRGHRFAWFAPNAGNWVTYRMEHRVANTLAAQGDAVLMIQCDRVLNAYCQVMSPAGLTASSPAREKAAVCRECRSAAGLARSRARYRTAQLSSFLEVSDVESVDAIIATMTPESWSELEVDGMPVGRFAAYTTLLHHKVPSVTETEAAWTEYLADLRGALLVSRALPRIYAEAVPTHAVVYNALYPANRVFAEWMTARGVQLLNLGGGPTVPRRYKTLSVYDGIKASQTMTDSAAFRASALVPVSDLEVRHVENHVAHLMSAADPWVYSSASSGQPAAEIRARIGVRDNVPVCTVIVSSPDETRASMSVDAEYDRDPDAGYSDVAEFIRASVEVARMRPSVDFVFRLHPRLAPNRRERLSSPDLAAIYDLLSDLPGNALVNHPSEGLSLYDLVLISETAINQSSSAGLEFMVFGLPIVQYDPVRASIYPAEFAFVAPRHDTSAFADAVDRALADGFDLRNSVNAFRWYASMQVRSVVHLDPLEDLPRGTPQDDAGNAPGAQRRHPLGRLLPGPVKDRLAVALQRRQRSREIDDMPLDARATAVLEAAIDHSNSIGDVWEPFMDLPTSVDAASELLAVRAALVRLALRMDLVDTKGMGAIRDAHLEIE